jgi:hypothetical protein
MDFFEKRFKIPELEMQTLKNQNTTKLNKIKPEAGSYNI